MSEINVKPYFLFDCEKHTFLQAAAFFVCNHTCNLWRRTDRCVKCNNLIFWCIIFTRFLLNLGHEKTIWKSLEGVWGQSVRYNNLFLECNIFVVIKYYWCFSVVSSLLVKWQQNNLKVSNSKKAIKVFRK